MIPVVAGIVEKDGKFLICQRKADVHNGLKWEFPGGKLEKGESPEAALKRELFEELEIEIEIGKIRDALAHAYPDRNVLLLFYDCRIISGTPKAVDCRAVSWVDPEELSGYDFADGDRAFILRNF